MTDHTTEYAKLVVSGKRLAGKTERQCCQRHLDDMAKGKEFPYVFDVKEAERHIGIANTLTIAEGTERRPLVTRGFQNFIIGSIFGWRKKRSKLRRYREGYIQMGRQNGKSFLAGVLCNDFCTFSDYRLGRIFCTATKQEQANIVWDEVAKFIRTDEELAELYDIKEYTHVIKSKVTGCYIKSIGRDTKSADGFRSILAIIDEYHAHQTDQMYKLMLDGQIKVDSALTLAITTAGFNLNGPCYQQYQFCKKVLSGAIEKDSLFVYIAELDEDDDIWKPENWAKANPLNVWKDDTALDDEVLARMAEKAISAKEKQGEELVNFETKTLNQWVTYGGSAFINADAWHACGSDMSLDDMRGQECYLGIDLSSGGDLTSIALIFPLADGKTYVYSHSFMPKLRLIEHEKTDRAPYRAWVNAGLMTLTEGEGTYGIKTDYKYIVALLVKLQQDYNINIIACGYDPHNAAAFLADLSEAVPCDLTEIVQSARSLSDATNDFALSVDARAIVYDKKNALMSWSMANAVTTQNSFGEIKIDKMTQSHRIDVVDAVIDAWKLYFETKNAETVDGNAIFDAWLGITEQKERDE